MLRTLELENKELNANDPWEPFLSAAAWAIRGTVNTTLDAMPGQLVFGQDMLLPIQLKTDWDRIRQRKQDIINVNNRKEIRKELNTSTVLAKKSYRKNQDYIRECKSGDCTYFFVNNMSFHLPNISVGLSTNFVEI